MHKLGAWKVVRTVAFALIPWDSIYWHIVAGLGRFQIF